MLIVSNRPPLFARVILVDDDLDSRATCPTTTMSSVRPQTSRSNRDASCRACHALHTPFTCNTRKHGPRISPRRAETSKRLSYMVFRFFFSKYVGPAGAKSRATKSPQSRRVHTHTYTHITRYCLADRSSFVSTHMAAQEVCHKVIRTPCKSFPSLVI